VQECQTAALFVFSRFAVGFGTIDPAAAWGDRLAESTSSGLLFDLGVLPFLAACCRTRAFLDGRVVTVTDWSDSARYSRQSVPSDAQGECLPGST